MRADSEERDGKIKTLKAREKNIIEKEDKTKTERGGKQSSAPKWQSTGKVQRI